MLTILGLGCLSLFNNVGRALQYAYPEIPWNMLKFSCKGKKSGQMWLIQKIKQVLPDDSDIEEDYSHPDLHWGREGILN